MAPKSRNAGTPQPGKADPKARPETPQVEEPPPPPEEPEEPEPESMILKGLGWEVCRLPTTKVRFFYSAVKGQARLSPPYYLLLGLDESRFRAVSKEEIWKAFFARKTEYKVKEGGALTEDLIDREMAYDWGLIMEAFHVLTTHEARAKYESEDLMPQAQARLQGLRIQHEARVREVQLEEAEARAAGYNSAAEMRAAIAAAAKAAAEQAALEAEEEAKKTRKKK